MNSEIFDFDQSNFSKEQLRNVGIKALSALDTANYWLNLHSSTISALDMYEDYFRLNEPKGIKRLINKTRVDPQLLSEIVAGAAWRSHIIESPPQSTMQSLVSSFETAKIEFDAGYACDAAVISETNGVSVQSVMNLIKSLKDDPRIIESGFRDWSTAVTLASAIFAVGQNKYQKVVDELLTIHTATGKRYDETTYGALLQASLLSSPEEVIAKIAKLESIQIHPKGFIKKHDDVSIGSKGFLVLAQTIGNLSEQDVIQGMKDLIQNHNLPQDAATRYILNQVNKTSESPVLNRQGTYMGKERIELDFLPIPPWPLQDGIPLGDQLLTFKRDTSNYAVALRLGGR